MKKKLLLITALLLTPLLKVKAASGLIDIYASNKNPTVGSTITVTAYSSCSTSIFAYDYTITYDTSKLSLISSSGNCSGLYCVGSITSGKGTDTFTFKVIASGSSTVSVKAAGMIAEDESSVKPSISPVTITGKSASSGSNNNSNSNSSSSNNNSSSNKTFSTNNNLKSLSVEGQKLDKDFNKDTLEYKLSLDSKTEKIKINAEAEDDKAKIEGTGEFELDYGENKFEIIVTSEKGTTKKYTIIATIEDKNPINITINKTAYTIVKKASLLKEDNYEAKTITINNQEIPALYNKTTNLTLVGLKNTKTNKIKLYIYNEKNNTYYQYSNIKIGNLSLTPLDKKPNNNYKKLTTITIIEDKAQIYKINKTSKFGMFYAKNNNTGKNAWYIYDEQDQTIQRYNKEELNTLNTKLNNTKTILLSLASSSLLFAILFIISLTNNIKIKSKTNKKDKTQEEKKKSTN